ncbi:MAG: Na+/H+ antiporter subunit E [Opitutales bacterium]
MLLATWAVFSGKFDAFHLGMGALASLIVTWLSQDLLFQDRKKNLAERIAEAGRFVGYVFWLLWQIVLANVHVFKLAMTKQGDEEMSPRVVTFRTKLKTDFAKFVFANSITLTPGTITIQIKGSQFMVHAISEVVEKDLRSGEMERRVAAIFEPEVAK